MTNLATQSRLTPGQHRANLRAQVKKALNGALNECDVTWRGVVALTLGVTRQRIDQWVSEDHEAQLSIADALAMPESIRRALAAELIGEGAFIADAPSAEAGSGDIALVARTQRNTAFAVSTALDVLADGHINATEGAALEKACDAAMASLLTARELGRRAQRERVVALRVAK
jgi:hypothetical protein